MKEKVAILKAEQYDLNSIKKTLLEGFDLLGFDKENPFGHLIKPGMNVFIKPNWVASRWRESTPHKDDIYCLITHPTVIEAVADFVDVALNGNGTIIIGDNPTIDADFDELMDLTQIKKLETKYKSNCKILDLRPMVCKDLKDYGDKTKMHKQEGDPLGITQVNLSETSLFNGINSFLFRGVFKQRSETIESHTGKNQLYSFSSSIYNADVYISIPKMKTHHKVGTTLNLKGLVGSIGVKNQLVHWRVGFPLIGGDEYPNFMSWLKGSFRKVKSRGSWDGNDTIWRMVVDIYKAFQTKKRSYFSVVDGIIAGEGNGPFGNYSKKANTLIIGNNFVGVDLVTTRYMGFKVGEVPYLNYLINSTNIMNEMEVFAEGELKKNFFKESNKYLAFKAPDNWSKLSIK